ncbi:MAG: folate family ECF transporter S component, partial [Ruthenibacterium sp.]
FLYGCWFYKRPVTLLRTFLACLSVVLVVNFCLTPLWLNIMYGNAFIITSVRLIKNCIKLPIDTALLYLLLKTVEKQQLPKK